MCLMGISKLSTFLTSDIQYLMESDELTTVYRPYITIFLLCRTEH